MRRPVLVYNLGEPPDAVAAAHGRFPAWFDGLWRDDPVAVATFEGRGGDRPPDPTGFAGAVLTGSSASVTEPEPWMEAAVEWLRHAAHAGTPVLGVCFGHQLIGAAFGGSVVKNPAGYEVSTHAVELTDAGKADPLFAGLPDAFEVNLSHSDVVDAATLSPRNGVRVLARNAVTDAQAIAAGDALRGVQFHPEFSGAIMRGYVAARVDRIADPAAAAARARDTPAALRVFANFTRHWILRA